MSDENVTINRILAAICKFLARHERAIDDVAEAILCIIPLVEQSLPRCSSKGCNKPATLEHSELGVLACDECCTKIMTSSLKKLTGDMDDPVNLARFAVIRDDMWFELEHAQNVRQLMRYVDVIAKNRGNNTRGDGTLH